MSKQWGKEEAKKGEGKPSNERAESKVCGGLPLYLKDLRMNLCGIMKMFTTSASNTEDTTWKFSRLRKGDFFFFLYSQGFPFIADHEFVGHHMSRQEQTR